MGGIEAHLDSPKAHIGAECQSGGTVALISDQSRHRYRKEYRQAAKNIHSETFLLVMLCFQSQTMLETPEANAWSDAMSTSHSRVTRVYMARMAAASAQRVPPSR